MPRSIKRPQVGHIVWYFDASPPTIEPRAALVTLKTDNVTYNVVWWDGTSNVATSSLGIKYYEGGTRPPAGATPWITHQRVVQPVAGKWPKDGGSEGPLGPGGTVVT